MNIEICIIFLLTIKVLTYYYFHAGINLLPARKAENMETEKKEVRDMIVTCLFNATEYDMVRAIKQKEPYATVSQILRACVALGGPLILANGLPKE